MRRKSISYPTVTWFPQPLQSIWREDGEFFQDDHEGISRESIRTLETYVEKWIQSPQIEKKRLPLTQPLSVSEGRRRQILL